MSKLISILTLFCWLTAKIVYKNNLTKNIFTTKGANKQITELN